MWVKFIKAFLSLFFLVSTSCTPIGTTLNTLTSASIEEGCDGASVSTSQKAKGELKIKKWNVDVDGIFHSKASGLTSSLSRQLIAVVENKCFKAKGFESELSVILSEAKGWRLAQKRSYLKWSPGLNFDWTTFKRLVDDSECVVTVENQKTFQATSFPSDAFVSAQGFWERLEYIDSYDHFFSGENAVSVDTVVAIIDSGIDLDHQDMVGQIWQNSAEIAGNGIDDDANGYIDDVNGYHFVDDSGDPDPSSQLSAYNTHGTAVAGLVGAKANGVGVIGVMPQNIQLMSLNVFGEEAASTASDVAEAIDYAVANGAKVINLSLGGKTESTALLTAITAAVAAGVVVVVASGNEATEISEDEYYVPAAYGKDIDGLIAVGAIASDSGELATYSNYSSTYVEIAAPGSQKMPANITGLLTLDVDNEYDFFDGTSFSAPLVTGASALAYAFLVSKGESPTPAQIESLIKNSADQFQVLTGSIEQCRSLNLSKLYDKLLEF